MHHKSASVRVVRLLFSGAILVATMSMARFASAQQLEEPRDHQGYYIALGGYGDAVFVNEDKNGWRDPWLGGSGDLRLGEAIFDWFDLGIGIGVGSTVEEGYRAIIGHLSLETQFRPLEPLFVRLGIGMGFADVSRTEKGLEEVIGRFGADFTVAIGYDFFPGKEGQSGGFAISPVVGFRAGPANLTSTYAVFVGIEISFWTGLSKDQLNLPMEEAYRKE